MTFVLGNGTELTADFAAALPDFVRASWGEEQPDPRLVLLNRPLAVHLGLDPEWLASPEGTAFLCGRGNPADQPPQAMAYAGFQFGQFNPHMGDGRALLLGEVRDANGVLRDLHVKGSGRTPFSRPGADGRATLPAMLREYVFSEALHAMGIPTTRCLAVISTGRPVARERALPGGISVRVAASHLRVGTFHYAQLRGPEATRSLADYAIRRHYPALADTAEPYRDFFRAVMEAQIATVVRWQEAGFIHGVMNTDNTTISGESIDFGPCAFGERFDPHAVFSSIDRFGRYAFGHQPNILGWNLTRLAESLLPILSDDPSRATEVAQQEVDSFGERFGDFATGYTRRETLGLSDAAPDALVRRWRELLAESQPDLTTCHRDLAAAAGGDAEATRRLADTLGEKEWVDEWLAAGPDAARLDRHHPRFIARPRAVENALDAAADGDFAPTERLVTALTDKGADVGALPDDERELLTHPDPGGLENYLTYCGT